jgi:2-oxo-3-hexenedioate decarboxylase/2-keto-4-pentenoate hydratase
LPHSDGAPAEVAAADRWDLAAGILEAAWRGGPAVERLPEGLAPEGVDAGYFVQDRLIARLGHPPCGWKIGCTSGPVQAFLGIPHPIGGRLLAPLVARSPGRFPAGTFVRPCVEGEFAFVLATDLGAGGARYTRESVAAHVFALVPAIEIVDSRYADWRSQGGPALIADNSAHRALVFGQAVRDWQGVDLAAREVVMRIDGVEAGRGRGADVLGHPLEALAWLANDRLARGDVLRAGSIISTGTCTGAPPIAPGQGAVADFGPLGTVVFTA